VAITKHIRRDHPYVGSTFQGFARLLYGKRNVILSGGVLSEDVAGTIRVSPFVADLGGIVVESTATEVVNYPVITTRVNAKFILLLSTPDDQDSSGVTWTVTSDPSDVSEADLVFAVRTPTYKGGAWSTPSREAISAIAGRARLTGDGADNGDGLEARSDVLGVPLLDATGLTNNFSFSDPKAAIVFEHDPGYDASSDMVVFPADSSAHSVDPSIKHALDVTHYSKPRTDRLVMRPYEARLLNGPGQRILNQLDGGVTLTESLSATIKGQENLYDIVLATGVPHGLPADGHPPINMLDLIATDAADSFVQFEVGGITNRSFAIACNTWRNETDGTYTPSGQGDSWDGSSYNYIHVAYQNDATGANPRQMRHRRIKHDRATVDAAESILSPTALDRQDFDMVTNGTGKSFIVYAADPLPAAGRNRLCISRVAADGKSFEVEDRVVWDHNGEVVGADVKRPRIVTTDKSDDLYIVFEGERAPGGAGMTEQEESLYILRIDEEGVPTSSLKEITDDGVLGVNRTFRHAKIAYNDEVIYVAAINNSTPNLSLGGTVGGDVFYAAVDTNTLETMEEQYAIPSASQVGELDQTSEVLVSASFPTGEISSVGVDIVKPGGIPVLAMGSFDSPGTLVLWVGSPSASIIGDNTAISNSSAGARADAICVTGSGVGGIHKFDVNVVADSFGFHVFSARPPLFFGSPNPIVYQRFDSTFLNGKIRTLPDTQPIMSDGLLAGGNSPEIVHAIRAASGEMVVATASGGDLTIAEVFGTESCHTPPMENDVLLGEIRVPGGQQNSAAIAAGTPGSFMDFKIDESTSARGTGRPREIVVGSTGGAGDYIGPSGIARAIGDLVGYGGTVKVRAGRYTLGESIEVPSSVSIELDAGAVIFAPEGVSPFEVGSGGGFSLILGTYSRYDPMEIELGPAMGTVDARGFGGLVEGSALMEVGADPIDSPPLFVTRIDRSGRSIGVSSPGTPATAATLAVMATGIKISGGCIVSQGSDAIFTVAGGWNVEISNVMVSALPSGGTPVVLELDASAYVTMSNVNVNGGGECMAFDINANYPSHAKKCGYVTIRDCRFKEMGAVSPVSEASQTDELRIIGNDFGQGGKVLVQAECTGEIRENKRLLEISTSNSIGFGIGNNSVGTWGIAATQVVDDTIGILPNFDSLNGTNLYDLNVSKNLYVHGLLNHGQYDRAIMTIAFLALGEEMFSTFSMSDGFTEDFLTAEDLAHPSVGAMWAAGEFYPSSQGLDEIPLSEQGAYRSGHSDQAGCLKYDLQHLHVPPQYQWSQAGNPMGSVSAIREVQFSDEGAFAGTNYQIAGRLDRGKIEHWNEFELPTSGPSGSQSHKLKGITRDGSGSKVGNRNQNVEKSFSSVIDGSLTGVSASSLIHRDSGAVAGEMEGGTGSWAGGMVVGQSLGAGLEKRRQNTVLDAYYWPGSVAGTARGRHFSVGTNWVDMGPGNGNANQEGDESLFLWYWVHDDHGALITDGPLDVPVRGGPICITEDITVQPAAPFGNGLPFATGGFAEMKIMPDTGGLGIGAGKVFVYCACAMTYTNNTAVIPNTTAHMRPMIFCWHFDIDAGTFEGDMPNTQRVIMDGYDPAFHPADTSGTTTYRGLTVVEAIDPGAWGVNVAGNAAKKCHAVFWLGVPVGEYSASSHSNRVTGCLVDSFTSGTKQVIPGTPCFFGEPTTGYVNTPMQSNLYQTYSTTNSLNEKDGVWRGMSSNMDGTCEVIRTRALHPHFDGGIVPGPYTQGSIWLYQTLQHSVTSMESTLDVFRIDWTAVQAFAGTPCATAQPNIAVTAAWNAGGQGKHCYTNGNNNYISQGPYGTSYTNGNNNIFHMVQVEHDLDGTIGGYGDQSKVTRTVFTDDGAGGYSVVGPVDLPSCGYQGATKYFHNIAVAEEPPPADPTAPYVQGNLHIIVQGPGDMGTPNMSTTGGLFLNGSPGATRLGQWAHTSYSAAVPPAVTSGLWWGSGPYPGFAASAIESCLPQPAPGGVDGHNEVLYYFGSGGRHGGTAQDVPAPPPSIHDDSGVKNTQWMMWPCHGLPWSSDFGKMRLRGSRPEVALKIELDMPRASEFHGMELGMKAYGHTSDASGKRTGCLVLAQTGFRNASNSWDIAHSDAGPHNDRYNADAPLATSAADFPAGGWAVGPDATIINSGFPLLGPLGGGTHIESANRPLAIPQSGPVAPIPAAGVDSGCRMSTGTIWEDGSTQIRWDSINSADGMETDIDYDDPCLKNSFNQIGIGTKLLVSVDGGVTFPTEHRVTHIGLDLDEPSGATNPPPYRTLSVWPPLPPPHGIATNNWVSFSKDVIGLCVRSLPSTGSSQGGNIVHPAMVAFTRLVTHATQVPDQGILSTKEDTMPVSAPTSAVVVIQFQTVNGGPSGGFSGSTFPADYLGAGGANIADYFTLELSRDDGASYQTVNFDTASASTTTNNPLHVSNPTPTTYQFIIYGNIVFSSGPGAELVYRLKWKEDGSYPGQGVGGAGAFLHIDRIAVNWN